MVTDSHQTGTLDVHHRVRSVRLEVMTGWLIIGLVVASLLARLTWNHYGVRYPGADRQSTNQYQVTFQYQTSDDLPKVLRWYVQHFGLSHELPQGENCLMLAGEDTYLFLRQSIQVTLCAQQGRTLIFVNRSFAIP